MTGRRAVGVLSVAMMAAGWLLSALWLVPSLRDFMAAGFAAGTSPRISQLWPLPGSQLAGTVAVIVLFSTGLALAIGWCRRHDGLGRVAEERLQNPGRLAMVIAVFAALISVTVIARGEPTIADTKTHISRAWIWEESLRAGRMPVWTDLWYGGFLIDQHYPPLSHILVAVMALPGISPFLAAKLVVWLASVIGAVGFGIWCHSFHRSPQSGVLGGVIYSLLPTIDAAWMWQGRLPGVVLMGILPWAFLAVHRLANRGSGRRAAAGLALCLGAIVLAHALQARLAFVMLAVYSIAEFIARRGGRGRWLLLGWGGGLAISLCFLIPVYLERGFVNEMASPRAAVFAGIPMLAEVAKRAFHWSFRGDWYPGLSVIALMCMGVWSLAGAIRHGDRPRRDAWAALAVMLAPWVFMRLGQGYAEPLFVGVAFIAAAGVAQVRGWRRSQLLPVAILLILVDLGPANLISTYLTNRGSKEAAYAAIEARQGAGSYLELPLGPGGAPRSSYWHYVATRPVACVSGPFIQGAPRSFVYRAALIDSVAAALAGGTEMNDCLVALLALENIGMIAVSSPTTISPPSLQIPHGVERDSVAPVWRVVEASPVSVMNSIPDSQFPKLPITNTLGIGTDTPNDRAFSRGVISGMFSWMESAKPVPVAGVRLMRKPNAVDLSVPDVGARMLRIALAAYPTMEVRIDGSRTDWREGPLGGILVGVTPGPHRISVECRITGARLALGVLLAAIVLAALLAAIVPERPNEE
jgi:hypothetical protein